MSDESVVHGWSNWYQVSSRALIVGLKMPIARKASLGAAETFAVVPAATANASLSTLIDVKSGGSIYAHSVGIGRYTGVLAETNIGRDRKSTRLNSSHRNTSRMPSSA